MLLFLKFEKEVPHLGADFLGFDNPSTRFFMKESPDSVIRISQKILHVTQDVYTTIAIIILFRYAPRSHASRRFRDGNTFFVLRFLDEIVA